MQSGAFGLLIIFLADKSQTSIFPCKLPNPANTSSKIQLSTKVEILINGGSKQTNFSPAIPYPISSISLGTFLKNIVLASPRRGLVPLPMQNPDPSLLIKYILIDRCININRINRFGDKGERKPLDILHSGFLYDTPNDIMLRKILELDCNWIFALAVTKLANIKT